MKKGKKYTLSIEQVMVKPKLAKVFPLIFAPEYFFFMVSVFHFKGKKINVIYCEAPLSVSSNNQRKVVHLNRPSLIKKIGLPTEFIVHIYTCMAKKSFHLLKSPWSAMDNNDFSQIHQKYHPIFADHGWVLKEGSWLSLGEEIEAFMTISMSVCLEEINCLDKMIFESNNRYSQLRFTFQN